MKTEEYYGHLIPINNLIQDDYGAHVKQEELCYNQWGFQTCVATNLVNWPSNFLAKVVVADWITLRLREAYLIGNDLSKKLCTKCVSLITYGVNRCNSATADLM